MFQEWHETATTPRLCDVLKMGITIFDDTWSTFIPEHKETLCNKIIRYYYFNNIGCETPDRFVHYLNESLSRMMPYYNQLYQSELIKIDPMLNHSIVQNGRSIENLLKTMKTDTTSTGKMLRDFVNNSSGYNQNTAVTGVKSTETLDKITQNVYNKDGTDDSTTNTTDNQKYHENKDTTTNEHKERDINEVTKADTIIDETGHIEEVLDGNKDTTQNNSKDVTVDTVSKDTDTGTIVDDGVGTSKSQGTKDWEEVKDDTAKTTVVTDLSETTTTTARKDYADTPQIRLSGSSSAEDFGIRKDYLTNVTWDTSSSKHDLDSTVTTDYKDDETKTHTEKTSDNTDTTDKNTKTTNMVKDGTSTETTTQKEDNSQNEKTDNTTTTDSTKDTTENLNKTVTTDDDLTGNVVENQVTDGTKDTTGKEVYDDDWTEKGNSDTVEKYTLLGTKDTNAKSTGTDTREGRENESQETARNVMSGEDTTRTTDTGTTDITKGFMNVSASALLEAFRKTFLNIDQKIIDDLADNFLSVY